MKSRASAYEVVMLLRLGFQMKKAMARAKRANPELARRLGLRIEAILARVRALEAGRRPEPWPYNAPQNRPAGARGPFGSSRFPMVRDSIDFRCLSWGIAGR
jgi:hypothetical protein